jgi:hypothetical protein
VVRTFSDPLIKRASQNWEPIVGKPHKKITRTRTGIKNKNAENRMKKATIYVSTFFKLFLLATSVKDSKRAVNQANINQNMIKCYVYNYNKRISKSLLEINRLDFF